MKLKANTYKNIMRTGFIKNKGQLNWLIVFILLLTASFTPSKAQDFKYYTQYMFNGLAINPAYAGVHDFITITGNIRDQWTGFEGAPSSQMLSAHSPIMNDQFGLGVILINDKLGVTTQQEVSFNYSYKLMFPNQSLSFGLKFGFNTVKNRNNNLLLDDESDASFQENTSAFLPAIGIGAYLKAHDYYIGLSMPNLHKFVHKKYNDHNIEQQRIIYLTGGYLFKIDNDFKIIPSILMKTHFGSVFEFDLNANLYYKEDYCVGLSYKSLNSVAIIMQIGIKKTYYIGYSYDLATSKLINYQGGTHEISINVYLSRKDNTKIINPGYF